MTRPYAILDVFTDTPLGGNPLAVVLDAEGLGDERMQAIAAEFNLSETVFVSPADNPVHSASIRIFTPKSELPFAGHPTVGTAILLGLEQLGEGDGERDAMMVLEEKIGAVRCGLVIKEKDAGHCTFDLPKLPLPSGVPGDKDLMASALGLTTHEIGFENHVPSAFDAGVPYCFVPVRDLEVIGRAALQTASWKAAFGDAHVYLYTRETVGADHQFHARMFAPTSGISEDPATGSAVAAMVGAIARFDQPVAGAHRYVIEQGFEMNRPSLIGLEIDVDGGAVHAGRISGDAVVVARGTLKV